ncbi:MAG TPA: Stp1/IreP family PP2C-type Ser/Thr phosphatase [Spirillospora sp.]|nr:Stp1/IreP family PP2C-type Ser/Thr phosphatase [Spirillospora sp.]
MLHSGDGIRLRSSARTSVGQVRENNEDSVHLWPGEQFVLAVVADGMGGAAAGEEASRMAIEAIQAGMSLRTRDNLDQINGLSVDDISERLRTSIQQANLSIMQRALDEPDMRGMGTTVTLAFVRGTEAIIAHVGDSRAYQIDGATQRITQITADHSFVEALLAAGHITPEQAEDHPMRNVLYRALGQAEDLDVDIYTVRLEIGDRLVLCSDGLTRHVKPEEIARLALADGNPSRSSQSLIDLANSRGGEDNVSVIVVAVESDNPEASLEARSRLVAEEDEEDTLVLKDRPFTRETITAVPEDTATGSAAEETSLEIRRHLTRQKMQAERISDTVETPAVGAQTAPADCSRLTKPVPVPVTNDSRTAGKPAEADGEGQDTRTLEQ